MGSTALITGAISGAPGQANVIVGTGTSGGVIVYGNTLAAGNTISIASGVNSFASLTDNAGSGPLTLGINGGTTTITTLTDNTTVAALTVSASSSAVVTINATGGASGSTIAFGGDGTGSTTLNGQPTQAGQLLKVTAGTVTMTNARNTSDNIEVDGGALIFNNTRLSTNANNQTLKITGGLIQANANSGFGFRLNGDNGAQGAGVAGTTFTGIQTGGTLSALLGGQNVGFSLGSTSANQNSTYTLSGGVLSSVAATNNGFVDLGADTAGTSNTTFVLSGSGKLLASNIVEGGQGTGARQAFLFNGGTLAVFAYNATNLTSGSGIAVSATTNTLTNAGGVLAAGDIGTAGKTTITGNYLVSGPNASLAIDIGGANAANTFQNTAAGASFDLVAVTGTATLGGKLNVGLINSFTPATATNFTVLTAAGGRSGTFTNLVTGTGGTMRVALANGTSSFTVTTAGNVVLGGFQASNTYNAATSGTWDAPNAASWTVFDPGSTSNPATQASGAIAVFADGALTGSGSNTVLLNSTRNIQGIQFASTQAGHNYTINDAGSGTGLIILDNTGNSAPATITGVAAAGNANAINVPILLNSSLNVSVANAANTVTLGGNVSESGSGSGLGAVLTKSGAGTTVLSGSDTYTGATNVVGGRLVVTGSLASTSASAVSAGATLSVDGLVNGAATISTSGTLQGQGSVGTVNAVAGTLAPGLSTANANNGTLTSTGNVTFSGSSNATLSIRLGQTSAGTSDQLALTSGTVSLNGANLALTLGTNYATQTLGFVYIIINGGAGSTGIGNNVFAQGNTITASNNDTFNIVYGTDAAGDGQGTGNDVVLVQAIPEPGTWAMVLGGFSMLIVTQRFRRRSAKS